MRLRFQALALFLRVVILLLLIILLIIIITIRLVIEADGGLDGKVPEKHFSVAVQIVKRL